jgi:hypothetical protein
VSIGLPVAYAAQMTIIRSWPKGAYRGVGTLSNQADASAGINPSSGRCIADCPDLEPLRGRMRHGDDQESEPDHPLSEDVSPPVFAIVALMIIGLSLAAFSLLGMFP